MVLKVVVVGIMLALAVGQNLVNRVRVEDKALGTGECWLRVVNTEEILDFRSDCPLGNMTHAPNYQILMQFLKPK